MQDPCQVVWMPRGDAVHATVNSTETGRQRTQADGKIPVVTNAVVKVVLPTQDL